jgi:hypothetical protein
MNTFRNYADYEIPLLQVLSDLPGGQGTAKDVRDRFGARFDDRIPLEHRVYLENVHDTKWRNMVAWVRSTLIERGLMDAPKYGVWGITDKGRKYLAQAGDSASHADSPFTAQSTQAPNRTVTLTLGDKRVTLSAGQVLDTARREVARGLPPAALDFRAWVVEVDGYQIGVKWLFGLATGAPHSDFKLAQARRAFEQLGIAVARVDDASGEGNRSRVPISHHL